MQLLRIAPLVAILTTWSVSAGGRPATRAPQRRPNGGEESPENCVTFVCTDLHLSEKHGRLRVSGLSTAESASGWSK